MDTEVLQSMFTTLPVGVVAAILFATAVTVITLRAGASLAIAFSLGLLVAEIFFAALPDTAFVGAAVSGFTSPYAIAGIYIAITLVLTFIFHRITAALVDDSARPLMAIFAGAATTVVVLVAWQMTPLQGIWQFSSAIQTAFSEAYRIYWLLVAFTMFAFVKS